MTSLETFDDTRGRQRLLLLTGEIGANRQGPINVSHTTAPCFDLGRRLIRICMWWKLE